MTTAELVRKYNITVATRFDGHNLVATGFLRIGRGDLARANGDMDAIRAAKPQIIADWQAKHDAERAASDARQAKIDAIPGLAEIRAAIADRAAWRREFRASFEGEEAVGGLGVRPQPTTDVDALLEKYPVAAAYLEAQSFADADNYIKSAAGRKAVDAILSGSAPAAAVQTMRSEWAAYCTDHIWD